MPLPPFPVDDATLDLLDQAVRPGPQAERSSVGDLMALIGDLAGAADPAEQYHTNDVIAALLDEVRKLRGRPEEDIAIGGPVLSDDAPSLGYRVDRMFAYLAVDDDGEGLIAAPIGPGGSMLPLVGADADRVLALRKVVRHFIRSVPTTKSVRLVRFDNRHVVEEFTV